MAVLQPVLWAALVWDGLERKRPGPVWRGRLAACLLSVLPVLLSLGLEMGLVHYEMFTIVSGRHVLHLADFMTYFTRLPEQVTWFGFILFCGGLASVSGRPRDWLLRLLSIYLLTWYLALTVSLAGLGMVHNRWQLPAYPAVAFFIAACLEGFRRRAAATVLLLVFLASCATWLPFPGVVPEYLTYRPGYLAQLAGPDAVLTERPGLLPYPEALRYIRYRLPAGRRILAVDFPDPREFYAYRYGVRVDWFLLDYRLEETWRPRSGQTPAALGEFCRDNRIEYLLLPDGRWLPYLDRGLTDRLLMDFTDNFELVRRFQLYGNEVYLWKTKKTAGRPG
ncbi:MAG: hypothetical protein BWY73_01064 [candidate division TA06 bacterium ADurb.Bin417]|uniref:Uncharacterized protein n=1 Tax=candidate division TA06 bacterium ADurb.Bin417 TaxID=1852828 RepID=A0A1V5ME58_UNCT6|nr:MAG: hypothetical protein BWY73_01064 [candidate division TA06 bacterium ADurb.Bin417]